MRASHQVKLRATVHGVARPQNLHCCVDLQLRQMARWVRCHGLSLLPAAPAIERAPARPRPAWWAKGSVHGPADAAGGAALQARVAGVQISKSPDEKKPTGWWAGYAFNINFYYVVGSTVIKSVNESIPNATA